MSGALRLELPFFPLNSLIIFLLIRLLISLLNIYPFVLFGVCRDNDSVGDGGDGTMAVRSNIQSNTNTPRHSPLSRCFWSRMISAFVIYIGCVFGFHNLLSKSSISKHQSEEDGDVEGKKFG